MQDLCGASGKSLAVFRGGDNAGEHDPIEGARATDTSDAGLKCRDVTEVE
jgi:hypothetical protein